MAAEVQALEPKQLMTATPLTPAQIASAISGAENDYLIAQSQLWSATTTFTTQVDTAVNNLSDSVNLLWTGTEGLIGGVTLLAEGAVSAAEAGLQGALALLDGTLQIALNVLESGYDGQIQTAEAQRQTDLDNAHDQFAADYGLLQSTHVGDVQGARTGWMADRAAEQGILGTAVSGAEATYRGLLGTFTTNFVGSLTNENDNYQTDEQTYWNAYLSAIGTGPTGLQTTMTSDLAAADSQLAADLSPWPGVVYDPDPILQDLSYQNFVDGELSTLLAQLSAENIAFEGLVDNRVAKLRDDINAPLIGPGTLFRATVQTLETNFENDADTLNGQLRDDLDAAADAYEYAVHGQTSGSLEWQFHSSMGTEENDFRTAIADARAAYNLTMAAPTTARDNVVQAETLGVETWLDSPTSTAKPIRDLMRARLQTLIGLLNGYLGTHQTLADAATNQFNADALAANQKYWDAVYKPNAAPMSAYDVYLNTLDSATFLWTNYLQQDYAAYQTAMATATMPPPGIGLVGMPGVFIVPPPPSTSAWDVATKEYWIQAGIDTAIYQQSTGAAHEAFIAAAVGHDTTRQQDIITAWNKYATALETARHALASQAITAIGNFHTDIIPLSHQLIRAADVKLSSAKTNLLNAQKVYELANNGAQQQLSEDGATAVQIYKKNAAAHINTFRTQENEKWKTYELAVAGHRHTWETGMRDKTQTLLTGFAGAEATFRQGVHNLQALAEIDIHGLEAAHTANLSGHARTFVVNVANRLATDYSLWHAGDVGQTAVGTAYATHTIARFDAAKDLADGEAVAYQTYGDLETLRNQAGNDHIATAAQTRLTSIFGPLGAFESLVTTTSTAALSFVQTLAPQKETRSNALANADKTLQRDTQDKIQIANDAIAVGVKTFSDAATNALFPYLTQVVSAVATMFPVKDALSESVDLLVSGIRTVAETAKEGWRHLAHGAEITLRKNAAVGLSTTDDPVINASAALWSKTMSHSQWTHVGVEQSRPLSDFAMRRPNGPQVFLPAMVIPSTRPLRPGAPPPSIPGGGGGTIDPSIFREPELGIANGLKTGLKALVNATADTGAGLISLGQWDPPDVWTVNQLEDIGYETSRIFADVGINVGVGAATAGMAGGVGQIGRAARGLEALDGMGAVAVGVQGVGNALGAGNVNLQNGLAIVGGVLGVEQLNAARNAAKAEQVVAEAALQVDTSILFGQRRISAKFGDGLDVPERLRGRPIKEVVDELAEGKMLPNQIEISYTRIPDGDLVTMNNRGLAALSAAGFAPTNTKFIPYDRVRDELTRRLTGRPILKDQRIPGDRIPMTVILPDGRHKVLTIIELATNF